MGLMSGKLSKNNEYLPVIKLFVKLSQLQMQGNIYMIFAWWEFCSFLAPKFMKCIDHSLDVDSTIISFTKPAENVLSNVL